VDERPRQQDRERRQHDVGRPAAGADAELGEDGAQAGQRRDHREHQDGELSLVFHGGAGADPLDLGTRHQVGDQRQVEPHVDVPAHQQPGRRSPIREDRQDHADERADAQRDEQPRPDPHDAKEQRHLTHRPAS